MFLQISADQSVNGSSTGLILPLVINIVRYQNVFYFLRILILFILKVRAFCFSWDPGAIWAHFHISLCSQCFFLFLDIGANITVNYCSVQDAGRTVAQNACGAHSLNCCLLWLWLCILAGNFLTSKIIFSANGLCSCFLWNSFSQFFIFRPF